MILLGNKVERLRDNCSRVLTRTRRTDHITPVLKSLPGFLLVIDFKVLLLLLYRSLISARPFLARFININPAVSLQSAVSISSQNQLLATVLHILNQLPTPATFQSKFKTVLFSYAFDWFDYCSFTCIQLYLISILNVLLSSFNWLI